MLIERIKEQQPFISKIIGDKISLSASSAYIPITFKLLLIHNRYKTRQTSNLNFMHKLETLSTAHRYNYWYLTQSYSIYYIKHTNTLMFSRVTSLGSDDLKNCLKVFRILEVIDWLVFNGTSTHKGIRLRVGLSSWGIIRLRQSRNRDCRRDF